MSGEEEKCEQPSREGVTRYVKQICSASPGNGQILRGS